MKATHQVYARALEALLAAQTALADKASALDVEIARPLDDDPLEAERAALALAETKFRDASEPLTAQIAAAWDCNVEMVQAAKQACRDAIAARATAETEIGAAVNGRLRDPLWPPGDPLITEVEQARLDAAVAAEDDAVAANAAAEALFKQGVTADQLVEVN